MCRSGLEMGPYGLLTVAKDFICYRILHVDDTPHRIALGVAAGILVAWTPTVGLQTVIVIAVAGILRANLVVGVPFVWVSNPLTFVPIYLPNYYVGRWVLGSNEPLPNFGGLIHAGAGWLEATSNGWHAAWQTMLPLWTGSLLVGSILAVLAYCVTYSSVSALRRGEHAGQSDPLKPAKRVPVNLARGAE